jgi:hypothetical protein
MKTSERKDLEAAATNWHLTALTQNGSGLSVDDVPALRVFDMIPRQNKGNVNEV